MLFTKADNPDNVLQPKHFLLFAKRIYSYCDKISDQLYDIRNGIETYRDVPTIELDAYYTSVAYAKKYGPTRRHIFKKIMNALDLDFSEYQFIDIGSGKGRVLIEAMSYKFKEIIGVEFSEILNEQSLKNISNFKKKNSFEYEKISVIHDDILNYKPTVGKKIFYLFNPFKKETLSQMLSSFIDNGYLNSEDIIIYLNPRESSCFNEDLFLRKTLLKSKNLNFRAYTYCLKG